MTGIQSVGVAVVIWQDQVLVGLRGPDGPLPGYAEFPGGKCHPGESPEACAVRECREETGLPVTITGTLYETEFTYPHGSVRLSFFEARPGGEGDPTKPAGAFRWIPLADLDQHRFPEANQPVIARLREKPAS